MSTLSSAVTDAGPMWSAKHHAPTVRWARLGSARRTWRAPTCASRLSSTSMAPPGAVSRSSAGPMGGASSLVTGPLTSKDGVPVHLAQRIADQLDAGTVGIGEVERGAVDVG